MTDEETKVIDLSMLPGRIDASFGIIKADLRIAKLETEVGELKSALVAAFEAMDAACQWAAGETAGVKTIEDANRHTQGYDALLDATVLAGKAAGKLR